MLKRTDTSKFEQILRCLKAEADRIVVFPRSLLCCLSAVEVAPASVFGCGVTISGGSSKGH